MSELISAAKDLPKDPSHALVVFAERASELYRSERVLSLEDSEFIIQFITKFTTKFGIKIPSFQQVESVEDKALRHLNWVHTQCKPQVIRDAVSIEVDDLIDEFLDNQEESFGLARLNEEEKAKIHTRINHIREIIGSSVLSDRKKNALYERLNRLASEVDAHGTRTERFFAFMGDVAFVMGDLAEKAKPLINEVKEMMRIVTRSRARQEGVSLPPGDDVILLPKPSDEI